MVKFDSDKVADLLKTLKGLPKIKEVKALQNRLKKELKTVKKKPKQSKKQLQQKANQLRSAKQKRYWRYVKLIRDNFPNNTVTQIRSELKKRAQGQPSDIPDAVWQNPSS